MNHLPSINRYILVFSIVLKVTMLSAQNNAVYLLETKDVGDGSWPCLYYFPNTNADITSANRAKWYALTEDESDWAEGFGPFSSENDSFYYYEWGSSVRPILIRRHFFLDETLASIIQGSNTYLTISYDEYAKIYLNGTLIGSKDGYVGSEYVTQALTSTQRKKLVAGDNVLAVSLQQGGGSGHIDFGLYFIDKENAIGDVEDMESTSEIYNLSGQRLQCKQKGVNIINGKKILY